MARPLDSATVRAGFEALDRILEEPVRLIVGGGTAMFLAHGVRVRTTDVDAYPQATRLEAFDPFVKRVARELHLAPDWINPHFATFAHVLPADYGSRLKRVFAGEKLEVVALGVEDLLIMKCFAGREKDVGHARALLRKKPDIGIVERRLQELIERRIPGAIDAADFFDDLREGT